MRKTLTSPALARTVLLLLGAAVLLVPAAHRSAAYLAVEELADILILCCVLLYKPRRSAALTAAVSALLAADTLYALMYLIPDFPHFLFQVQVAAYMVYSLSAAYFLFRAYQSSEPGPRTEPAILLLLFSCFTALQIKYVAIPVYSGVYASPYVYTLTTIHRVAESAVLALAVLLGMKARSRYWFYTLNGLTLLPLSSFAIGYSTTTANGVPYAEYGWVLGLFSLLAAQTYPLREGAQFARWHSLRVRLVWFVSLITSALLLALYLLQAFAARDAFHMTSSLFFMMFGVWFVANFIAFRVSEDIHALLEGLETPGPAASRQNPGLAIYEADLFAEKLRAAYDTIRSQSRLAALAKLSAQVAHDIRSPLAALDSALKDVSGFPEDKRLLIRSAAGRIRDISEDLLEKNRREGPAGALPPEACRLSDLVEAVLAEKRLQFLERKEISLEYRPGPGDREIFAAARPAEFSRILSNLINNGVEALAGGGSVVVRLSREKGKVIVTVSDDGKGIPPEILSGLGARGKTYGKAGGSGLGLYHAKNAVESWGGNLSIHSEPGKGAAVSLALLSAAPQAGPSGRPTVLLDDDELVHFNWRVAAKAAGVDLRSYKKAGELLAAAEALPKDAVLYIDSELGEGAAGEEIAKELHGKGFSDITMATGHGPETFAHLAWLKVAGKEPPWER